MAAIVSIVVPARDCAVELPALPPGADEILVQSCGPPGRARNVGVQRARGDILLFIEDDLSLTGSIDWLRKRPPHEVWWACSGYADLTGDPYTRRAMSFLNTMLALRNIAGVGPVVACRRTAWAAVGGYDDRDLLGDFSFARKLYKAFGIFPAQMPVWVGVHRPNTPPSKLMAQRGQWFDGELPEDGPFRRLVPSPAIQGTLDAGDPRLHGDQVAGR